jgi:hypothetical protein
MIMKQSKLEIQIPGDSNYVVIYTKWILLVQGDWPQ